MKGEAYLRDGGEIIEQVGGAYAQLLPIQGQVLFSLLAQISEVLLGFQVKQSYAGL